MINTVLFDLDGTLLPMDMNAFMRRYFGALVEHFADRYDPDQLKKTLLTGTKVMIENAGDRTNEQAFWQYAQTQMPLSYERDLPAFTHFYETDYERARSATWKNPLSAQIVASLKRQNMTLVVATNPVFPVQATNQRLHWAGLDPDDFALVTTYDAFHFCKPSPKFYDEVLAAIGKRPDECIMVGNDNQEDMVAETRGIRGYLITDCLINRENAPITCHWRSTLAEFSALAERGL